MIGYLASNQAVACHVLYRGNMKTLIQEIMNTWQAAENCRKSGNQEWLSRHEASLQQLCHLLPSGAGVDNGTTVVKINRYEIVLSCSFHHMNEHGFYDGWTDHTIRVRPDWEGIEVRIGGPNRNEIKDYLHDLYLTALTSIVVYEDGHYKVKVES